MTMEVFEYQVYARGKLKAGFNDLDLAKEYAKSWTIAENCNAQVVNAFTGELHYESDAICTVVYRNELEVLEKIYEVKEWVAD